MKKRKPVAVINRPLRLSGRRRQATRPHPANEKPTRLNTTAWSPTLSERGDGGCDDRAMRIVVAEDQALLREGVVRLLEDAGFDVVAEAADAPDLLRKVGAHKPDVAIVDVQMPPDNTDDGLRAAMEIRKTQPGVGVLVLSQFAEERYALDLIGDSAEGVGYLLKDRVADFANFADAVGRVAAGGGGRRPPGGSPGARR